jgi:hypothetical protein
MSKCLAVVTGTLAVIGVALLATHPAEAGASASAASKYTNAHQVASAHSTRTARNSNVGITEYSSSSAKTRSQTSGNH